MRNIKIIFLSSYYETKILLRNKEGLFYSFIFPVFLFLLFGGIWGRSESYLSLLLSGVIGMNIASDALFSIGPVIRAYRERGIIKFLKNLPVNPLLHFLGMFLSRTLVMCMAIILLCFIAFSIFKVPFDFVKINFFLIGSLIGVIAFGLMGLTVSFFSESEGNRGILNFIFLPMLFLSGTFYPLEVLPRSLQTVAYLLPLTHLNLFLRGEIFYMPIIFGWALLFSFLFHLSFKKSNERR